ncbi:MAG: hypothetical protein ACRDDX_04550 [Cellulosilyticaceae bacterium]
MKVPGKKIGLVVVLSILVLGIGVMALRGSTTDDALYAFEALQEEVLIGSRDYAVMQNGKIILLDSTGMQCYILSEDKTIEQTILLEQEAKLVACDEADKIYICSAEGEEAAVEQYTLAGEKTGERQIIPVNIQGLWAGQLEIIKDDIYLINRGGIYRKSLEEEEMIELRSRTNYQISEAGDIFFIDPSGMLSKYEQSTKEVSPLFEVDRKTRNIALDEENNKIYLVQENGIVTYSLETNKEVGTLDFDAIECLYDEMDSKFYVLADDRFIIKTRSGGLVGEVHEVNSKQLKVLKNGIDTQVKEEEKIETLVVTDARTLVASINSYNEQVQQKMIQTRYLSNQGPLSQLTQKVATELLTGNMPELLQLGYQNIDTYIEKDMIQPIDIEAICPDYNENLKEAYTIDNQQYGIELDYYLMAMEVNEPLLKEMGIVFDFTNYNFKEFLELVRIVEERKPADVYTVDVGTIGGLSVHLLDLYYHDVMYKQLDSSWEEELESLFLDLKGLNTIALETPQGAENVVFRVFGVESYYSTPIAGRYRPLPRVRSDYYPIQTGAGTFALTNMSNKEEKLETSLKFLEHALSEEVQMKTTAAFPANNKARQNLRKQILEEDPSLEQNAADIDLIISLQNGLVHNDAFKSIVMEQNAAFMYQEQPLEDTIKNIREAIDIARSERE